MAAAWLRSVGSKITGLDDKLRASWLANLLTLPIRSPWVTVACVLAVVWIRIRRRHRHRQPSVANFEQALRRAKLTLRPGETPREVLARASGLGLPAERLSSIQAAAREHERNRYQ